VLRVGEAGKILTTNDMRECKNAIGTLQAQGNSIHNKFDL